MVGQLYSISEKACMILFKDGPVDGQQGLYDHKMWNSIHFWNCEGEYVPDGELGHTNVYKWKDKSYRI